MFKSKLFNIVYSISILIIALSIAYYFLVVLPNIEQSKIDLQRLELLDKKQTEKEKNEYKLQQVNNLDECLNSAKKSKENSLKLFLDWANSEEGKNEIKSKNINLSNSFNSIDTTYKQDIDQCYKKYPQ